MPAALSRFTSLRGRLARANPRRSTRTPGKVSLAPKGAGRVACGSHKTLSALGRWFGFELDEIFSGLVGSAGCKIPGLVWRYHNRRYGLSLYILPLRTRMGSLNRIAPANTLQARRRPWGALPYGEVRARSAADAYLALTRKETGIAVL